MSDTIVIDGEVELLNVIDGDPDVFIGGGGSQPTGTKSILLTEAGTKTEDVADYASAEINAVTDATASGAVASFSDGAEDVPMDSCVVNIEPVQNLHGQSNPYPPGGGSKNLLPMILTNMKSINTSGTWNGNTYTLYNVSYTPVIDDGGNVISVTVNGTASQYSLFRLCNAWTNAAETIMSGTAQGSSGSSYRIQAEGDATKQDLGYGVTIPANYSATRIIIVVPQGISVQNAVFKPMIRLSSVSDSTFAPYSNICPISGWSEVKVTREGKNLLKVTAESTTINGIQWTVDKDDDGRVLSITANGTSTGRSVFPIWFDYAYLSDYHFNGSYILSGGYSTNCRLMLQAQGSGNIIDNGSSVTFDTSTMSQKYRFACEVQTSGITLNNAKLYPMVRYSSISDSTYEPYIAQEYPISLGQTVYGGTLDVVSGVLTVDRVMFSKTLAEANSSAMVGTAIKRYGFLTSGDVSTTNRTSSISDIAPYNSDFTGEFTHFLINSNATYFYVYVPVDTSTATMVNICYPLATPTTVQLTPTEVTTLLGSNNVWADSGDISVGYKADVYLTESGVTPTGTKSITITTNGTTTEDVASYASAEITTNVPNSYSASDEGKVVSNGALVSQTSDTVTENDTYDTTLINSLTVNVSGGGFDWNRIAQNLDPYGDAVITSGTKIADYAFSRKPVTSVYSDTSGVATKLGTSCFAYCSSLTKVILKYCTQSENNNTGYQFQGARMKYIALPRYSAQFNTNAAQGSYVQIADIGSATAIATKAFSGSNSFNTLILRRSDGLTSLANTNGIAEGTMFRNGGTGGTIYIPKVLYDHLGDGTALDYQSATNWATIYGYGTITWAVLEGSAYESMDWADNL